MTKNLIRVLYFSETGTGTPVENKKKPPVNPANPELAKLKEETVLDRWLAGIYEKRGKKNLMILGSGESGLNPDGKKENREDVRQRTLGDIKKDISNFQILQTLNKDTIELRNTFLKNINSPENGRQAIKTAIDMVIEDNKRLMEVEEYILKSIFTSQSITKEDRTVLMTLLTRSKTGK